MSAGIEPLVFVEPGNDDSWIIRYREQPTFGTGCLVLIGYFSVFWFIFGIIFISQQTPASFLGGLIIAAVIVWLISLKGRKALKNGKIQEIIMDRSKITGCGVTATWFEIDSVGTEPFGKNAAGNCWKVYVAVGGNRGYITLGISKTMADLILLAADANTNN